MKRVVTFKNWVDYLTNFIDKIEFFYCLLVEKYAQV